MDPYKLLGISPSASDEEVTQAYRSMAKKYHPDLHPNDKQAEQKMKEINAAYEQIKRNKHGGASYEQPGGNPFTGQRTQGPYGPYGQQGQGSGDPFGGFDWSAFEELFGGRRQWQQQQQAGGSPRMQAVHNFIVNRQYQQAIHLLTEIPERDAQWHYYSALANAGLGNRVAALNHAREASTLEPENPDYRSLYTQFQQGSFTYQQAGSGFGFNMGNMSSSLWQLCLAQLACWFCCRC